MNDPEHDRDATSAILAESLARAESELRAQCETEGLLSTYEEVYEHFLGEEAYVGYSLRDWIRDAKFQYKDLQATWEHYRISLVMAHIVSAKVEIDCGRFASAEGMLQDAGILRHDLKGNLPFTHVDPGIADQRPSQRGGLVKDLNRKFKAILNCLEDNHKMDGKDFKSFDEAVEYGIEMWIAEEQSHGAEKLKQLRGSLPKLFKDWLRLNADAAARFKVFTGIAWND